MKIVHDIGNQVFCDFCGEDYTHRTECGGILFESKAACPDCKDRIEALAKQYKEERFIKGRCPEGTPFNEWCLSLRNGDNTITITAED